MDKTKEKEKVETHKKDLRKEEPDANNTEIGRVMGPLGGGDGFAYYDSGVIRRSDGKRRWGWWWI